MYVFKYKQLELTSGAIEGAGDGMGGNGSSGRHPTARGFFAGLKSLSKRLGFFPLQNFKELGFPLGFINKIIFLATIIVSSHEIITLDNLFIY